MPATPRFLILASVSALALSCPALAQDAAATATTTDDSVFVLGDITLTVDDVAGYFANGAQATKSSVPISEAQQSISVVTEEQIIEQGSENLGEALNYSTGVLGQPFGNDPRFNNPTLRGFPGERAQYVNGLRQGRLFGAVDYETYGMQQVEVLRGPSSSLYGSGSPAGIINQVQKRARSTDFGEVGLGLDSDEGKQLFFDVNRAPDAELSWRLTGTGRDIRTQIDDVDNQRGYLAGALRWTPDDATTVDFLSSYTKDSPITPVGVPYALTQSGDLDNLRDLNAGEPDFDDSDRKLFTLGVEVSHELENGWTLSQGVRYEDFDWTYDATSCAFFCPLNADGTFDRTTIRQSEDSQTLSADTRLSGEIVTGATTHQVLLGLDVQKYDSEDFTIFGTAAPLNPLDPVYNPDAITLDGFQGGRDITFKQIGLYAQDEVSLGNWRGSLGLRYDKAEQEGLSYGADSSFDDSELTGRAGLAYAFANGLLPYVSYSTSFEPLPGTDIEGAALQPTEGKQWEVGLKYSPTAFEGLFTAAIYDLRQTNLTRPVSEVIDGEIRSGLRQIGEAKSRGLELSAIATIAEGWDVQASYAYNDTEQLEGDNEGNALPNAPKHLASLWVMRDFGNGIRAGGGIRHVGERFGDEANTLDLDSQTLLDLGASYTRDNIEATLNVSNLTDKAYVASCSNFGCFFGQGRTVTAKVSYKW